MNKNLFKDLLKQNKFLKIWTSQVLSQITVNLINFLVILRVYEHTHSSVAVALVSFFWIIPTILIGPFAGVIVDLADKRKILLWTNIVQAFVVLLYLGVTSRVWPLYSVIFFYSIINQLYVPAEYSSLPLLVKKDFLPAANSLFMMTMNLTFLLGYTLAGPLVRLFGKEIPYLLGMIFLLIAAWSVWRLPVNYGPKSQKIKRWEDFFDRLQEGYLFIKQQKTVLFPLVLVILAQVILYLLIVVVPIYSENIIKVDLRDAALVLITPAGLGALVGSQLIVKALQRKIRKRNIVLTGLISAALAFFSLSFIIPNLPHLKILFSFIIIGILGICFSAIIVPSQTLIQEQTPKILLGRVLSVLSFVITLCSLLPILFTATLVDLFGVRWILFFISVGIGFIFYKAWNTKTIK